ncbi:probable LRR receptor-like serine/threonine-protein kinase At3g47570 [Coffea arabica]|uniref:Probable LRR receptor-like serine/threonine-protein kinase At3g47570 n=1 Tax=Coffea arabica TaxID=13443 RepID=A0ABM4VEK2_COFAR
MNVMIDLASALEYLHHTYSIPVVHCDLKPSNVLLNEDMVACVTDFGAVKILTGGENTAYTNDSSNIWLYLQQTRLRNWVKSCAPNAVSQVVEANLLKPGYQHFAEKLEGITSIMRVAIGCTEDSPRDKMNAIDVLAALKKIKVQRLTYCGAT